MNRIRQIREHGQSIWYDYIQRGMVWTGALHRMVEEDGLAGVTSNPAIFEKAIGKSKDYEAALKAAVQDGASAQEAFESLAVTDIQLACDVLGRAYEASQKKDGFVSLEVSPHLAYDTAGTLEEAHRLWHTVRRDNLMIKVPGTDEGVPAIEHLIADGINVNVTLLFSVERYEAVHEAYLAGLERWIAGGGDPRGVASVASFFVSRIDSMVDDMIAERLKGASGAAVAQLEALRGKVAIANAKMAYRSWQRTMASERWKKLAAAGAQPQRLLWASTGTKNPAYSDVIYLEELIGPETVNTVPEATYAAFMDHGVAEPRLLRDMDAAEATMKALAAADLSMKAVTDELVKQGVVLFQQAFDRLMGTVERRRAGALGAGLSRMELSLGEAEAPVTKRLASLGEAGFVRRLWQKDGTLFAADEEEAAHAAKHLGWLDVVDGMEAQAEHLVELQDDLQVEEVASVVLMGMGGSSLAPDVFARTFGQVDGAPELLVLDSTVPAQVKALEKQVELDEAVFMVASKSGTTTEPLAFDAYFFDKVRDGDRFMAITDPGSKLELMAMERDFRGIYNGDPEIGGRYSALSPFGLVPAAAMGLDVVELLHRARRMMGSCQGAVPPDANPGVRLGAAMGELALAGRDKLTLVTSPKIASFGAWVEQLVAESTGKHGKGIVPVDGEALGAPEVYGADRVFAYLAVEGDDPDHAQATEAKLEALAKAGHPVLRFRLADELDLVQEMYRWEIATATAGHVLGINPFDQPNVQESKTFTAELLASYAKAKSLPPVAGEVQLFSEGGITVITDAANAQALSGKKSLKEVLSAHFGRLDRGDYAALNAFVEMSPEHDRLLQRMRHRLRDEKKAATTVGYGPRFLHSTGQLHKGGANNGVFLQITSEAAVDLPVPKMGITFGVLVEAQARGDFLALSKRDRRLLRVHLGKDVKAGLETLAKALGA